MGSVTADIKTVLEVIGRRTESFLQDELGIAVLSRDSALGAMSSLTLGPLTSIMGVNGPVNMLIAFSYDEGLILRIFEAYTEDIDIPEDERQLYMEESAGDIANIIVGNSTQDFQLKGKAISVSPPVTLTEAKRLVRNRDATFSNVTLQTEAGRLTINFIGPKELFDEELNYKGGAE